MENQKIIKNNQYIPPDTFLMSIFKNFIWGILGIISGLFINNLGEIIYSHMSIKQKYNKLLLQLVICCIVLAYIHTYVSNEFGWTWQNTTPGLFYTAFFFGCQFLEFNILQTYDN